ncbi:hypothetical protein D3C80_1751600 [compost metagenome]
MSSISQVAPSNSPRATRLGSMPATVAANSAVASALSTLTPVSLAITEQSKPCKALYVTPR